MAESLVNNNITFKEVLVINSNGEQLGVMSVEAGIAEAKKDHLDLVCVSQNTNIPVCKIMNYGKFKFEQAKKEKAIKKNQTTIGISEVQFSLTTQDHDLQIKANTVKRLISKGNNVRVVITLRGREMSFTDEAIQKMEKFVNMCSEYTSINKSIKLDGKNVTVVLEKKK